ncbi:unnamed protein product, partial [Nesidiocoris tenuis]
MSLFRTLESWKNYKNTYHLFITTFLPQFLVTYRLKSSGDKPFYSLQAYVSSELLWPTLTKNVKELITAIKEVYPHLERHQYSLYCRYNGTQLYPILDHMTLVTAYTLMDAHDSFQLYMIRK